MIDPRAAARILASTSFGSPSTCKRSLLASVSSVTGCVTGLEL
jgi:hypothetical protein